MRGVWTALVTPLDASGKIDLPAFKRLLKLQREAGVRGVVPCGTTGESPTLSREEKQLLIRTAVDELKGSGVGVIAGTGSNNTAETIELSRWASDLGVDGLLLVTPYYNKPTQAGLEAHFTTVADAATAPVMLYNVPGRTGISLTAETVARLAKHPRIRWIKEATANPAFTSEIRDACQVAGSEIEIYSGDDATFLPLLSVGAAGVVSVASNLFPAEMVAIQKSFESGKVEEALKLHQRFYPLFRDLFIESNPSPIKAALAYAGICGAGVRLPLVAMSSKNLPRLHESLARCGIQKAK